MIILTFIAGGLHWQGKAPKYADYWSCAFVKISGGPEKESYTPQFRPAPKPRRGVPQGKCETGSVRPMECGGDACETGPVKYTVPEEFQNGKLAPAVKWSLFGKREMKHSAVKEAPKEATEQAVIADKKDKKADAIAFKEEEKMKQESASAKPKETNNPIHKLIVTQHKTNIGEVMPDGKEKMSVPGAWAMIEADLGKVRPERVLITVEGVGKRLERRHPYRYPITKLPMNKWIDVSVQAEMSDGTKYSAKFELYFTDDGDSAKRKLDTRKIETTSKCIKSNLPAEPTGTWGVTYSSLWWKQREVMMVRRRFCRECPDVC